jgi:response regulator NasT
MINAKNFRIVIIDAPDLPHEALRAGLLESGCSIVGVLAPDATLVERIVGLDPDVIIIDELSGRALQNVVQAAGRIRRPTVCFTEDDDRARMQAAIEAGVSAYVVGALPSARVMGVLDLAIARFDVEQKLRDELWETKLKLAERKVIDRAKGMLMARHHCTEDDAYRKLRRQAMDRNMKLSELAQNMLDMAGLLA